MSGQRIQRDQMAKLKAARACGLVMMADHDGSNSNRNSNNHKAAAAGAASPSSSPSPSPSPAPEESSAEERALDEVLSKLPDGVQMKLPAYRRRRVNEPRQVAILSPEFRVRETRRQLSEARSAFVDHYGHLSARRAPRRRSPRETRGLTVLA